jgi:hypothetical protein
MCAGNATNLASAGSLVAVSGEDALRRKVAESEHALFQFQVEVELLKSHLSYEQANCKGFRNALLLEDVSEPLIVGFFLALVARRRCNRHCMPSWAR